MAHEEIRPMRAIIAALALTACSPQRLAQCDEERRPEWMTSYEVCEFLETAEAGGEILAGAPR